MHGIRTQFAVAQYLAPALALQWHVQFGGNVGIQGVIAHLPQRRHHADFGHRHQQHLCTAAQRLPANGDDVGTRIGLGQLAQKVIAANADDDERGPVLLQQRGQARERLGAGVARDATVHDLPARQFLQHGGIGGGGIGADARGQRIAQRQHVAALGNGAALGGALAAGGEQCGGGQQGQQAAAGQGTRVHALW